ncbi:MAG: sigma E protease regulator RseP [Pseudomonadota bacterium]
MISSTLLYAVSFIVALGILVAIHEFGHFWTARTLGVKVLRFSVGFGKPLWQRTGDDGTEYVVAMIPLGGYVKMLDEREGDVDPKDAQRAFNRQSVWTRIAIVAAGPIANFLLAIVAYWLMFVIGISGLAPRMDTPVPGSAAERAGLAAGAQIIQVGARDTASWESVRLALLDSALAEPDQAVTLNVRDQDGRVSTHALSVDARGALETGSDIVADAGLRAWLPPLAAVIDGISPGEAAERAGLRAGDRILAVDGEAVDDWGDWVNHVRSSPGEPLRLLVERGADTLETTIIPGSRGEGDSAYGFIGASAKADESYRAAIDSLQSVDRYGPVEAVYKAIAQTWHMTSLTVQMIGKLVTGQAALENVSGPLTIAQFAGESARVGVDHYLKFIALISVSLAVLNLLPVPVLDGGHLLFFAIEVVKGSPLSDRAQLFGQQIGLALLAGLMGLAFYNDILRLIG